MSSTTRASSENVTSLFCNNFSIITSHFVCRMRTYYPGIKLAGAFRISETKHSCCQVTSVLRDCVGFVPKKQKNCKVVLKKKKKKESDSEMYKQ